MSLMQQYEKIPFHIRIYAATAGIYTVIAIQGVKLYDNAVRLLENLGGTQSPESLAAARDLLENEKSWILYGGIATLVVGAILTYITAGLVHRLIYQTLRAVSRKLEGVSKDMTGISSEVSRACTVLAEGSSQQAASLEETSASLEELASMAKQNTQNVLAAKNSTNQARVTAEAGAQEMQAMTQVMGSMQTAGEALDRSMGEIKQSGDAISKIIKTIDEIAFQTNILALNAAVEAARAGEAGLGFAVVADEVRNLAKRSADAARETSNLIENSISKSDQGVQISQRVSSSLKQIIESSQGVDKRLQEIVGQVRQVDTYMNQISESSQQQDTGVVQITNAVHEMDKVTQTSASSSEEAAASAIELNTQANVLQVAVAELMKILGTTPDLNLDYSGQGTAPVEPASSSRVSSSVPKTSSVRSLNGGSKTSTRPTIKLTTTRLPKVSTTSAKPRNGTGTIGHAEKNKAIPMDDFRDF